MTNREMAKLMLKAMRENKCKCIDKSTQEKIKMELNGKANSRD